MATAGWRRFRRLLLNAVGVAVAVVVSINAYRKQKVNINNTRKMSVSNFEHFLPDAAAARA